MKKFLLLKLFCLSIYICFSQNQSLKINNDNIENYSYNHINYNDLKNKIIVEEENLVSKPFCESPCCITNPANASGCVGSTKTFTSYSGAISQWQVNTGSGFINIINAPPYADVTTEILKITNITAAMYGYSYRCLHHLVDNICGQLPSAAAILTVSMPVLTNASQTDIACGTTNTGTASVNPCIGGVSPYTYIWTPGTITGNGTVNVTGLVEGIYTCIATDNIGCITTTNFNIGILTSLANNTDIATNTVSNANPVPLITTTGCRIIATLKRNGSNPVSGNVDSKVWVENIQPAQFVKRHFEITPSITPTTATAFVTLYFSQQEFSDFNAVNTVKLPLNALDIENYKPNLLIEKRSGSTNNSTGLPNSYIGAITYINPVDGDIKWIANRNRWEVSFDVAGFSGFFAKTTTSILPIKLDNFTISEKEGCNQLNWEVSQETNGAFFEIEQSNDGQKFKKIGSVNAVNILSYKFLDCSTYNSLIFYRLKLIDKNGSFFYSDIKKINSKASPNLSVYPNPVQDKMVIQIFDKALLGSNANLIDVTGKIVKIIMFKSHIEIVDMNFLPQSIYILRLNNGTCIKIVKTK